MIYLLKESIANSGKIIYHIIIINMEAIAIVRKSFIDFFMYKIMEHIIINIKRMVSIIASVIIIFVY